MQRTACRVQRAAMIALAVAACRGEPVRRRQALDIARLVDSLRPGVERAAGLTFKSTPRSAMKTREEVRAYLLQKLNEEMPSGRIEGMEAAYRLFGLIPDTLQIRSLVLDLYTEQVAGFYDPTTSTLYGVEGAAGMQFTLVLAHEMVHALQDQYTPLDSLLHITGDNDRQAAAQAILEGQANLASIEMLVPNADSDPAFWETFLDGLKTAQSGMKVFSAAPLIIREGLLFPYVTGAEFMRWWKHSPFQDRLPYGPRMPVSTEQIIHPDRYQKGDQPVSVRFADSDSVVLFEDDLGELELRILIAVALGNEEAISPVVPGWGGDRYRVYRTPGGPALVWYIVWDAPVYAERFQQGAGAAIARWSRPGYRIELTPLELGGRRLTRLVVGPAAWAAWSNLPEVTIP